MAKKKTYDKDAHLTEGEEFPETPQSKVSEILDSVADKVDKVLHPSHKKPVSKSSDIQNHPKFDKFKKGKQQ